MQTPHITNSTTLYSGNFIGMHKVEYTDAYGVPRTWETVQRQNNRSAVHIFAHLMPSDRFILIRQFRVPMGKYCIECPAGLIDDGETPTQAALRELKEETGYIGTVEAVSAPTASSPGMTGECVYLARMTIDETLPQNQNPTQDLDPEEAIQTFLVSPKDMQAFLNDAIQRGDVIDSRLASWAMAF